MSSGLQPLGGGLTPLGGGEEKSLPVNPPGAPQPLPVVRPTSDFFDDEAAAARRRLPLVIGGIVLALVLIAFFMFRPLGSAATPTGRTVFIAADEAFSCEVPRNWEQAPLGTAAENGSETSSMGISLTSGGGKMEVTFSTVAGLAAGQLLFGGDLTPGAMQGQSNSLAVAKMQKKGFVKRYEAYKETLQPSFPSGMGATIVDDSKEFVSDAVLYEFTARGNSLRQRGAIHGFRAAMAGGVLIAAVTCYCEERDWERLKPEFLKFIGSIHEEKPKQPESTLPKGTSLGSGAGGE